MHPSRHAKQTPNKAAIIMASSGSVTTYRELEERSNQLAHWFRNQGLKAGDAIALFLENHPRFFEICWAAQRSGLYYTAISSRLGVDELSYIVNNCKARVLISSKALLQTCLAAMDQIQPDRGVYLLDIEQDIDIAPTIHALEARWAMEPTNPIEDESSGYDMLYSSGTTGRPKGVRVPLTGEPIDTVKPLVPLSQKMYRMDESTIYLSPAPLYHAAPLRFNMTVMRLGGTCVIMEQFDAEQYLSYVERYQITHTQLVPTMFVRMLKLPEASRKKHRLDSLNVAIHAAAPCPIAVKQAMIDWWGPILYEYYAGTEGNGLTMVNSEEWLQHPGTVGKAVLGVVKIVGDDGTLMPKGEAGTVYFADGPSFEYFDDPGKTAESRHPAGWSTLGDIGYLDDDDYLYLTDRKAFMIISGGVNIYPQEAENILILHPEVLDVAVFGVPDEEFGEAVKAVVQLREPKHASPELAETLIEFCRSKLSAIKCPRSIDFEAELPRHPTGKLYKRLLRDRYWQAHAQRKSLAAQLSAG
jgi:long-chain acyl-CoA synthetase